MCIIMSKSMSIVMLQSLIDSYRSRRRSVPLTNFCTVDTKPRANTITDSVFRYGGKCSTTLAIEHCSTRISCSGVGQDGVLTFPYMLVLPSNRFGESVLFGLIWSTCPPNNHHLALYLCSPESVSVLVCGISQSLLLKFHSQ